MACIRRSSPSSPARPRSSASSAPRKPATRAGYVGLLRETREQLIERLTNQLASAHRRCDPADPATKDTIAASLVRVRELVDRLADPLSADETAAIEAGTLELLALYP